MRPTVILMLSALAAPALAQLNPLPLQPLTQRTGPRATWSSVASSGTTVTGSTFRCDNMGAASNTKMYVFGGCLDNNTATTLNDLWEFDPIAGTFTQVNDGTSATAPHQRGRCSVAWNFTSNKLVVFGGDTRSGGTLPANTLLNDTWEWDPTTNVWTDVTPLSGSPSPRRWAAMAWEPNTGGMLLFGGDAGAAGAANSETWLLLGGAWIQFTPANVPPARRMASLVTRTNPEFNDVLLCGGEDTTNMAFPELYRHLDVWTWNGGDWTLRSNYDWSTGTGTFPASAMANQAVYDAIRKRVVLQGGQGIAANTASNTIFLFGTTTYNGSPSDYTSEFDCVTNSWSLYATNPVGTAQYNNNDPAIGRISRYFGAFIPATGKVYKAGGQNAVLSGSRPTYNVYEYQASPVAAATVLGAGCNGLNLAVDQLPWTGRTVTAAATGFGATSIGFGLIGFGTQTVPLNALHPAGMAGCSALVTPDVSLLLIPVAGAASMSLALPNAPAFAGLGLNMQAVQLQMNAQFQLVSLSSTNGVALTIGAL